MHFKTVNAVKKHLHDKGLSGFRVKEKQAGWKSGPWFVVVVENGHRLAEYMDALQQSNVTILVE